MRSRLGIPAILAAFAFAQSGYALELQGTLQQVDAASGRARVSTETGIYEVRIPRISEETRATLLDPKNLGKPVRLGGLDAESFYAVTSGTGYDADCSKNRFGSRQLDEILSRPDVRNPVDLLRALPADALPSFTLVYDSRSPQKRGASARFPRVVRSSPDGKLVITYVCDPRFPGRNEVEVMAFDDRSRSFKLTRVDLSAPPAERAEENPVSCRNCHGEPSRPVWDSYPNWHGVYGGAEEKMGKPFNGISPIGSTATEKQVFADFKRTQRDNPCYNLLPWGNGMDPSSTYPYMDPDAKQLLISGYVRPNTNLTSAFSRLNAQALAERIRSMPGFAKIRDRLLGEAFGCPSQTPAAANIGDPKEASPLLYDFARKNGVSDSEWSLRLDSGNPVYGTGGDGIPQLVQAALFQDAAREDPELSSFASMKREDEGLFGPNFGCLSDLGGSLVENASKWPQACALFQRRAAAAGTGTLQPAPKGGCPRPDAPGTDFGAVNGLAQGAVSVRGRELVQSRCVSCHSEFSSDRIGSLVKDYRAKNVDFQAILRQRLSSADPAKRMPKDSVTALGAEDQSAILRYFSEFSRQ